MFGFVTSEDRARWAQKPTPEQREAEKRMFAQMAEGASKLGQKLSDSRLTAEQTGHSIQRPRKVTRVITEHVRSEEDLDAGYDY